MPLSATLIVQAAVNLTSALDLVTGSAPMNFKQENAFAEGNGLNQAEDVFSDQRTITASSTDSLDLSGGLTNIYGVSLTFTKIKAIIIKAAVGNTNDVGVLAPAANGLADIFGAVGDKVLIRPGGTLCLIAPTAAGYAVTAATADLLDIVNEAGGTSVIYDIIIVGATS